MVPSDTKTQLLPYTDCVCHSQSASATDSVCLSQTVLVRHRQLLSVDVGIKGSGLTGFGISGTWDLGNIV